MGTPDQAADGGDWRMQLKDMRTAPALRAEYPPRDAAERLPDRALIAAAQNPDHSAAGRAAAAEAARARNVTVTPWRLNVPGFLAPGDLDKGQRLFFGWGRRVRVWSALACVLVLVVAIALGGVAVRQMAATEQAWVAQQIVCAERGACPSADNPIVVVALDAETGASNTHALSPEEYLVQLRSPSADEGVLRAIVLGVFVIASVLPFALLWLAATLFRRRPARLAVFAPPPSALTRAPLARFIRRELRPFGHVLLHAPDGPIRSANGYRAAAILMANKLAMNLRAAHPSGVALRIGGAGGWAPLTRALGEGSADALIVDLSQDADAALAALGANPARCVFVALWGKLDEAEAALHARGINAIVHHYAPDGEIQRRGAFRAGLLKAMGA